MQYSTVCRHLLRMAQAVTFEISVLFLLLLIVKTSASAQYSVNSWTTDNGLPQNSVKTILQTHDGYLWFGTQDGLVRFDGLRFVTFNTANTKGISSNRLACLFEDHQNRLWIGTEDGGLIKYKNGGFTTYRTESGLPADSVLAIRELPDGRLIVQTSGGTAYLDGDRFVLNDPLKDRSPDSFAYLGKSGTVWYYDRSTIRMKKDGREIDFPVSDTEPGDSPVILFEDNNGALWIGTFHGKLRRFKDGTLTTYTRDDGLPGPYITSLFEDQQGNLWVGSFQGSLSVFQNGHFTTIVPLQGPNDNSILSICQDNEGGLWFGSTNRGLNRLNHHAITMYTIQDGLAGDNVYPIYRDHEGTVWAGADGLNKLSNGRFISYGEKNGLRYYGVMSLLEDHEGRLWVGSVGGLSYFQNGKFTLLNTLFGFTPNTYNVWAIIEDHANTLWFGTDKGLVKYKDGAIRIFTTNDGLPDNDIKSIYEDKNGNLWLATYGGIARMSGEKFISYTEKDGLAGNRVRSLYEDSDGTFWIGTYDAGLTRLKDGKFTRYTTEDGLYNNGVFQILEDDQGNFWISCNRGIYRTRKQELNDFADGKIKAFSSVYFGKEDGLLNIECNGGRQPAGMKMPDGKLWFPTQGGIAVIDPKAVPVNSKAPPVLIESSALEHVPLSMAQAIQVPPTKGNLEITYTALSLVKSDQIRFKYKLEGLDNDWNDVGPRRTVYFSHLPPGEYDFVVKAANSDGVWNETGARIHISVIPPFWRTWTFIAISSLAVMGIIALTYKRRVSQLQRQHAAQAAFSRQLIESQEGERKRIAAELHDSLGQNLLVIKNWALLALTKAEGDAGLKDQLTEISTTASQSIEEVREISHNLRPYQLDDIGLTRVLKAMVNRIALSSGIEFTTEIDGGIDDLLSPELQISLYRIVQEAINNIVKHSKATAAKISLKKTPGELVLAIQDNGQGFSREVVASARSGRRGFGLTGMKERARMLGGVVTMQSEHGQGAKISLVIPLQSGNR